MRAWAWWVALVGAAAGARELDPAACASRFDVQRDKIIRTEESREMGARYLSELDVGARAECLRLCCETDACDVFVYEEKGPGSCYLFNCGPPEDFRCKFTAHSNFSSGVLALSRRLAELQDQEQRAHREHELASLRSASSTTSTSTTTAAPLAARTAVPPPPYQPTRRCSRYQFECRRGGECVAVYNACDGVPQCADGSDEAPELGCPPPPAPPPPPATSAPTPTTTHLHTFKSFQESAEAATETERWPHRLAQAQPHRYVDEGRGSGGDGESHIFSHKGGLLQEAEGAAQFAAFEPPAAWPRRAWHSPPQPPQPPPGAEALAPMGAWGGGYARDWEGRGWPVPPAPQPPPPRVEPDIPVYVPPKTMPEVPVVYSSQQQTLRDSAKKGPAAATRPPSPAPRLPPGPAPEHTVHSDKEGGAAARQTAAAGGAGAGARGEPDGPSERPPAAVLLLVLGLLMTTAAGGLAASRARAARRRRPPLAHHADYLVNGMYL